MEDCQRYHDLIAAYAAGDISAPDSEDLMAHCQVCADCLGLIELHRSFTALAGDVPEPSEEAFAAMRQRVLNELELNEGYAGMGRRGRRAAVEMRPNLWHALANLFGAHPVAAPALVALMLAIARFGGREAVQPNWSSDSLLRAVQQQAGLSNGLLEFWDAPFTFSNVVMGQTESGSLTLGFDACRYVEAETSPTSALAQEIFMAAIVDSPTLGVRMKAMELAPSRDEPRLQEALIYSLHNDGDMAVRMQALRALGRYPLNTFTEKAMLTTLREDTAVAVRLLALETLAAEAEQVDPTVIRRAVSEAGQATDGVIMQRVAQLLGA